MENLPCCSPAACNASTSTPTLESFQRRRRQAQRNDLLFRCGRGSRRCGSGRTISVSPSTGSMRASDFATGFENSSRARRSCATTTAAARARRGSGYEGSLQLRSPRLARAAPVGWRLDEFLPEGSAARASSPTPGAAGAFPTTTARNRTGLRGRAESSAVLACIDPAATSTPCAWPRRRRQPRAVIHPARSWSRR